MGKSPSESACLWYRSSLEFAGHRVEVRVPREQIQNKIRGHSDAGDTGTAPRCVFQLPVN